MLGFMLTAGCTNPAGADRTAIIDPAFSEVDSWIRFQTNNSNYAGFFFWEHYSSTAGQMPIQAEIKRMSGYEGTPNGLIFAHQGDGSYYAVMLSTFGSYRIGGYDGTDLVVETDWITSADVNTGYDVANQISVSYSDPDYTISINGSPVYTLNRTTNSMSLNLTGGEAGFLVSISKTNENFPRVPVEARFRITSPVTVP